jgi:hypothetical protein
MRVTMRFVVERRDTLVEGNGVDLLEAVLQHGLKLVHKLAMVSRRSARRCLVHRTLRTHRTYRTRRTWLRAA